MLDRRARLFLVMPGLDPGIHVLSRSNNGETVKIGAGKDGLMFNGAAVKAKAA